MPAWERQRWVLRLKFLCYPLDFLVHVELSKMVVRAIHGYQNLWTIPWISYNESFALLPWFWVPDQFVGTPGFCRSFVLLNLVLSCTKCGKLLELFVPEHFHVHTKQQNVNWDPKSKPSCSSFPYLSNRISTRQLRGCLVCNQNRNGNGNGNRNGQILQNV